MLDEGHQLWVNDERTIFVRLWPDGEMETASRETPSHIWGPPVRLMEEGGA